MFISVMLNCWGLLNGYDDLDLKITPYTYANGQSFKGIIHVHNNFDDNNAFDDSCEMSPGEHTGVTYSSSYEGVCVGKAVSIPEKVRLYLDYEGVKMFL